MAHQIKNGIFEECFVNRPIATDQTSIFNRLANPVLRERDVAKPACRSRASIWINKSNNKLKRSWDIVTLRT